MKLPIKLSQKQIVMLGAAGLLIIVVILVIAFSGRSIQTIENVKLTVWGVDSKDVWNPVIDAYRLSRPGVEVAYFQISEANYDSVLLNALAAGQGPDVLAIKNTSLPRQINVLSPVPASQFDLVKLESLFPTIIKDDFTSDNQIYSLPLYIDTLALIYNKDLFDQAGIVAPPRTWNEFQNLIPYLRSIDENGRIVKAAAAIGGSEKSIDGATDLLELLMIQNGAQMVKIDRTGATFADQGVGGSLGLSAFNFYLQFANAASSYYTWSDSQPNSLDSFAGGNTAMIFNYHSELANFRNKSPFLNFRVAPMPQVQGASLQKNYADYWGLAATKQGHNLTWAWDFILYATTNEAPSKSYLGATKRPPALKTLIAQKYSDPEFEVFGRQALTARSWYQADEPKINNIFNSMIVRVLSGQSNSDRALRDAQDQVSALMR